MIRKLLFIAIGIFVLTQSQYGAIGTDDFLESKCGTFYPGGSKNIARERKLSEISAYDRPILQKKQSSPSGRFLVHYDITGTNAVNLKDENANGVPDYIDSVCYYFEFVHNLEVEQLKYLDPAKDNGLGGSDAFDIYVLNIGRGTVNQPGLYGYTVPEIKLPGGIPSRQRYSAYIVIDNDYSQRDSSYTDNGNKYATFRDTSMLGMKITAAHEYHHAVQFMYGEDRTAPVMNELTSTWFEYRAFPETKDYMQYVEYLFKYPNSYNFGNGNAVTGYLYGIFGRYLHKHYGDSLLLRMWETIATGIQSYDALNRALIERSSTLSADWCEFMLWLYYTNERTRKDYGFVNAAEFPLMTYYRDEQFRPPSFTNSGWLSSYEYRFFKISLNSGDNNKTPDVFDVILTNTDILAAIYQSDNQKQYILSVTDNPLPGYSEIGTTGYYYNVVQEKDNICEQPILREGIITHSECYAFPNPFVFSKEDKIYFPVPLEADIDTEVELYLMDNELNKIYEGVSRVTVRGERRVIEFNPHSLNNISGGIYLFRVIGQSKECFGKIAIIKQ